MRINRTVMSGLKTMFGPTGHKVWVYVKPNDDVCQFWALHPDRTPPETHPDKKDYKLVGYLDLKTERVVERSGAQPHEAANMEWLDRVGDVAILLAKLAIGAIILAGVVLVAILSTPLRRSS